MPPLLVLRDRTLVHHCLFLKTVAHRISYCLVKDIGVPVLFQALFADKHRLSQIFPQTVFFWPWTGGVADLYSGAEMGKPTVWLVYYTATLHYNCSFKSSLPYITTLL